jgi:uroporphyrinogen-III synthase
MLGWGSPSLKIWMPRTHITGEGSRLGHALKQYPIDLLEQGFYELMPLSPPSFQWGEASSWCYFSSQWAVVFWARYLECIHATESMTGRRIACVGEATAATVLEVFQRPANFMPPHAQDAQHFSSSLPPSPARDLAL